MERSGIQPSDLAADCFAHGLARLIEDVGWAGALTWAAEVIVTLERLPEEERPRLVHGSDGLVRGRH